MNLSTGIASQLPASRSRPNARRSGPPRNRVLAALPPVRILLAGALRGRRPQRKRVLAMVRGGWGVWVLAALPAGGSSLRGGGTPGCRPLSMRLRGQRPGAARPGRIRDRVGLIDSTQRARVVPVSPLV